MTLAIVSRRFVLAALLFGVGAPAFGQSAANVAVVINESSVASQRIGDHYIQSRAIPASNVIRLKTAAAETISRTAYASEIELPVAAAIRRHGLQDRVLYIVLTKGIPLRITGTDGQEGTVSSVDSELTLLYRRMTGTDVPIRGRVTNPYYLGAAPISAARPFTHRQFDIYLVTRLDAFTIEEAIGLVDRARAPVSGGRFVLDQRGGLISNSVGDRWLAEAQKRLTDLGLADRVLLETTTTAARDVDNVLGYYSWGSNDPAIRARRMGLHFVPGALAATFVSTDARTFETPPQDWQPTSDWTNGQRHFAGSPQSLIGDLIRDGATGVAGHVAEPYLQSTIRPEILFPAYVRGFNLAEAFYMAMPDLSWQTVVVGDPLCTAFPRTLLTAADIEGGVNTDTELPDVFSERRTAIAIVQLKAAPRPAVQLLLRAESREARDDHRGAREALEAATKLAPELTGAQLKLAQIDETNGDYAAAAERYRQVLNVVPNQVIAMNNLAYHLSVREQRYAEALELAKRAAALSPLNPSVIDTLAWIEHLSGNSASAAKRFAAMTIGDDVPAEVLLHSAIVFAAVGNAKAAATRLQQAIERDPALEQTAEVRELRAKLKS